MNNSSTKTTKAVRATIYLGTIPLEVFQLPDGEYRVSQSQILEAINAPVNWITRLVVSGSSERLKTLQRKGFTGLLEVVSFTEEGNRGVKKAKTLTIPDAVTVWRWFDKIEDNVLAEAIIDACAIESIEIRADAAFGVQRTQAELQAQMQARIEGKLVRRELTDAIADYLTLNPELSENKVKFIYNNVSDCVNLKVFGRKASKLRVDLGVPEEGLLRDFYNSRELLYVQEVEDIAVRLIDLDAMDPLLAVKEAASRLLITIQTRTK